VTDPPIRLGTTNPFADPPDRRDPLRRFRGRLAAPVTIWTAGATGLTVSALLVAGGRPALLFGLLSPDSDLWETLQETQRCVVHVVPAGRGQLADVFAGLRPSPGGLLRAAPYEQTPYGPRLSGLPAAADCRLAGHRAAGQSLLVETEVDAVHLGEDAPPLLYHRGRYRTLA